MLRLFCDICTIETRTASVTGGSLPAYYWLGREVMLMKWYEIAMILLEGASFLVALGTLIVAFLSFLDERKERNRENK